MRLKDKGNSVFVVEHDPDIIKRAEYVVDIGPRAGALGGEVVFAGSVEGLEKSTGLTGAYLNQANRKTRREQAMARVSGDQERPAA